MSRWTRIGLIAGSGLAGAALGFAGYAAFTNAPLYQHQYYRDANEWFGLKFLLELPIATFLFAVVFGVIGARAGSWRSAIGMLVGVVIAYAAAYLLIYAYVPEQASLTGDSVTLTFVCGWAAASALLAWLGGQVARRLAAST